MSGDIKFEKTWLFNPAVNKFPRLETLVLESTYGGFHDIQPSRHDAAAQARLGQPQVVGGDGRVTQRQHARDIPAQPANLLQAPRLSHIHLELQLEQLIGQIPLLVLELHIRQITNLVSLHKSGLRSKVSGLRFQVRSLESDACDLTPETRDLIPRPEP